MDEDACHRILFCAGCNACSGADAAVHSRALATRSEESHLPHNSGDLSSSAPFGTAFSQDDDCTCACCVGANDPTRAPAWQPVHAASLRKLCALHAHGV